ncbi:cytochrome P450 [Cantharellus anzutake]|uniref:cytochrome P450 n=1 Tax=Cantharellus anzutake TaxID=1750568 RepID=UPI001906E68A|nr:cytochrome P450 [Cantharellus anzutake]KAF8319165.1 cytochrome P450 [Cantharellus anzutake]
MSWVLTHPILAALGVAGGIITYHFVAFLLDPYHYNDGVNGVAIPGPLLAKLSNFWLLRVAIKGDRSGVVHELHQKYGKVVRIAPNHISIADPDAAQELYAANGSTKSDFYDAFVAVRRGLFNVRDPAEHARKRKIISRIFSQKAVLEFEPYVRDKVAKLLRKWDGIYQDAVLNGTNVGTKVKASDGKAWFDVLEWFNFLAFDVIGDLAFGAPFGMLDSGKDLAPVHELGSEKLEYHPAIKILGDRGVFASSLGVVPAWLRPLVKQLPHFTKRNGAVGKLTGIAIAAVEKRLQGPSDRNDILSKLLKGTDRSGNPMGREELIGEAHTQLIGGSDTTSTSSCVITYYIAMNPGVQRKLQAELDEAWVKALPYLEAVIQEGLRIHTTLGLGLPRIVPQGGLTIAGRYYKEGSVLSVPNFTTNRDPDIWGADADKYRPERWLGDDKVKMQKAFIPFSCGPRSCVGKNLANMNLRIFMGHYLPSI